MFNDKLDDLELRLQELEKYVDLFYIVESDTAFSGKSKPLHFRENRARFQRFLERIVHIVVPGPQKPTSPSSIEDSDDMEESQQAQKLSPAEGSDWKRHQEAINNWEATFRSQGLFMALDTHRPDENDWVLFADLDEIPKPKTLQAFRTQDPVQTLGIPELPPDSPLFLIHLLCDSYRYSYEFKAAGKQQGVGPVMIRFMEHSTVAKERARQVELHSAFQDPLLGLLFELSENDWRTAGGKFREVAGTDFRNKMVSLPKSCWRCSWCFSTMEQIRTKLDAYCSTDLAEKEFRTKDWILDRVRSGKDLLDGSHFQYEYVANNTDVPNTLVLNKDKYSFMLARKDEEDAGFLDALTYSDPGDDGHQPPS